MEEKIFEFKNIFVELVNKDKKVSSKYVRILDGISGKFRSGGLTAVLGASGAGKSTLFDVLMGKIDDKSKTFGSILYNGKERKSYDWIHQVSYHKQFDTLFPKFSIMESLMYNLDFYKSTLSKKDKISFAEEILRMSNIYDKRHAYIESLSGGEYKRAMIALVLCADPEIIFMDEPTTGLDSHSALTLISFMKKYAESKNKIVVISLHQPGEALFYQFRDILFLGRGAVFYDGEVSKLSSWLQEKGLKKLDGMSLAEYLFELHSDKPFSRQISQAKPVVDHIIETNRQKHTEIREGVELKKGSSSYLLTTTISLSDIKTLWRRLYLDICRTRHTYVTVAGGVFFSLILCLGCLFVSYRAINMFALENGFVDGKIYENIEFMKKNMSENGINLLMNNFLLIFYTSFIMYVVSSLNYDFFESKDFISDDILAGKYSTLTAFLANLLHDILSSSFWCLVATPFLYLSPLRSLIPWTFLPILILFSTSYAVGFILLKHLCGGSKIISFAIMSQLIYYIGLDTVFSFKQIEDKKHVNFGWFKYISYVYLLFPPLIFMHILFYRRYIFLKPIVENREVFLHDVSEEHLAFSKANIFYFIRLSDTPPYWVCYLILLLSIIINVVALFFLFIHQLKIKLRLKLN